MFLSPRTSVTVRPWRTLLATLALTTAGAHAQEQTARLVKDANATQAGFPAAIEWVKPVGTKVVFPMDTLASGKELWISDGTAKGTLLLKDIVPGSAGSRPQQGTSFGTGANTKVAFLTAPASYIYDASYPPELDLWVTDGTAAGTVRVLPSPFPLALGETNLRAGTTTGVFLEDRNRADGVRELFFSDGTAAGTRSLNPVVSNARKFNNPANYYTSGEWCYFAANTNEVWRSDGTDAGTTKVATLTDLTPRECYVIGDTLYVNVLVGGGTSSALWKVPAAGGTPTRFGPPTGTTWRSIRKLSSSGSKLVFVASDSAGKASLWASDGTEAGTTRIPLTLPGQTTESAPGAALAKYQEGVYLFSTQTNVGTGLWKTDGTVAGTTFQKLTKSPYSNFDSFWAASDGVYYFTSTDKGYQIWRSQGTPATTVALKGTPLYSPAISSAPVVAPAASTVYFLSAQGTGNEALVRMKTTKGGSLALTRPTTKINGSGIPAHPLGAPGYQLRNGGILEFVNTSRGQEMWQVDPNTGKSRSLFKLSLALKAGGTLGFHGTTPSGELFTRFGGDKTTQLFVTNGVARGTSVLAEDPDAYAFDFAQVGSLWFFSSYYGSGEFSSVILKTDGTDAGTSIVKTTDGASQERVGNLVSFQNALYYIKPTTDGKKRELWRTDGTPAGTVRVANTWYGDATESIHNLSTAGGKLYFAIFRNGKNYLWQSDGTAAGTVEVSSTGYAAFYTTAMDLAGVPVLQAQLATTDLVQWWTIGSGSLTRIESPAIETAFPTDGVFPKYAVAGSKLFFSANSTAAGDIELWVTNGTTAGTHRVKDINPGPEGSRPSGMVAVGNYVHFVASNTDNGREIWRSDGTDAGTVLAADVEPGPDSSAPHGLKAMGGRLYFSAYRRTTGRELYSVDMPQ